MLRKLRKSAQAQAPAADLYRAIVARSREPVFYREWQVPDTIDGRFDLLTLHAFLVFDALRGQGEAAQQLGTLVANTIFTGFDEAMRELGISDFGMPHRIRKMADAFYGRIHNYGIAKSPADLAAAVQRNLFRGDAARADEAAGLASYMIGARQHLKRDIAAILAGNPGFGPLPEKLDQP